MRLFPSKFTGERASQDDRFFFLSFVFLSEKRRRTFPQPFVCVGARATAMLLSLSSCVAALALYGLMALLFVLWKIAMFCCRGKEKMKANPNCAPSCLTAAWLGDETVPKVESVSAAADAAASAPGASKAAAAEVNVSEVFMTACRTRFHTKRTCHYLKKRAKLSLSNSA